MKLLNSFVFSTVAVAQYVADTDGKCKLIEATCDHEGFHIVFDQSCRDTDYRAVQVDELYAAGWDQSTTLATFGSAASANSECLFAVDPTDATKYKMDFNYRQCSTDYPDSDATELIYRNTIQAQEYYADIILGVQVRTNQSQSEKYTYAIFNI